MITEPRATDKIQQTLTKGSLKNRKIKERKNKKKRKKEKGKKKKKKGIITAAIHAYSGKNCPNPAP